MNKGLFANGTCCVAPFLMIFLIIGFITFMIIIGLFVAGVAMISVSIILTVKINNLRAAGNEPSRSTIIARALLMAFGIIFLMPLIICLINYLVRGSQI